MELKLKEYKIKKTGMYLKDKAFFLIYNGVSKSAKNGGILCEQKLKEFEFSQYKIYNRTSLNVIKNSIFNNALNSIHGTVFFMESLTSMYREMGKESVLHNFESISFVVVGIKMNRKIYSSIQAILLNSFKYNITQVLLFQFILKGLKPVLQLNQNDVI